MSIATSRRFSTAPVRDSHRNTRGEPSWLSQHPARAAITSDSWTINLRDTEKTYSRDVTPTVVRTVKITEPIRLQDADGRTVEPKAGDIVRVDGYWARYVDEVVDGVRYRRWATV